MKSKSLIYIFLFSCIVILNSCNDDFLEKEPSEFISSDQINDASEDRPQIQAGTVKGLYTTMYNVASGGSPANDPSHDDFGQKGYDIFTDMLSGDMILTANNYSWYNEISNHNVTKDFTNTRNYFPWRYYYRIIFGANRVVDALSPEGSFPEDETAQHLLGQAKAMRAYAYFYLAQLFAEDYDPSTPILPIYSTVSEESAAKSSTKEVYDFIVTDLTEAIELLATFNRTAKNEVNEDVARGLLAYTYAAMGLNEDAAKQAKKVLDNGGYTLMSAEEVVYDPNSQINTGFNTVDINGWIWGVDITLDAGLDLISWWGQMDIFTYSYASVGDTKAISQNLFDKIPDSDVRKGQFIDAFGDGNLLAANKFYTNEREIQGQRYITTDYVYMRVAEMYLLYAETSAKANDEASAKTVLKEFLEARIDDTSYIDGLSGQQLLDEIYLQTRIELWGEGKSYLAMKRNKATVTYGSNHLYFPNQNFPYNVDELTFDIPQSEIINNPNLN